MPTIPDKCEFTLKSNKIKIETQNDNDRVLMYPALDKNQAAILAYLINLPADTDIKVEIEESA